MRRIIFYLSLFLLSTNLMFAQMTDDMVLNFVKTEVDKGSSQQVIAQELLKRGVTKDQLERVKNQVNQQNQNRSSSVPTSGTPVIRTNPDEGTSLKPETDEGSDLFTEMLKPQIFGKNIFSKKNLTFAPEANIPTPEDYKLGPGDEVVIDIWGASQTSMRKVISPEGNIIIENLGPVFLSGKTVEDANIYVRKRLASAYSSIDEYGGASQIKLSLGQIRTIQVNVVGEVQLPGTYSLSSLSSVFHALYSAGGTNGIGSLRSIQLYRKGKLVETIDIYDYILNGKSTSNVRLSDGDMILVQPYISLVKVSGKVKRPMIYEMTSQETLGNIVKYAGGFTGDAYQDNISLSRKSGNYDEEFTIRKENYDSFVLKDKDVITIGEGLNQFANRVQISGSIFRPGYYEIGEEVNTVKNLISKAGGLKEDAYKGRAVLTREKEDLSMETLPINLDDLLTGSTEDIRLKKNDVLFITSERVLFDLGDLSIYGEVAKPGTYSFAQNTTIKDLIVKAGGLLNSASTAKIDISRRIVDPMSISSPIKIAETFTFDIKDGLIVKGGADDFTLKPYDQVYVRRSPGYVEQRNVVLSGEVLFPGSYTLGEKEQRLSDVIKGAGGLTIHAYSKGAKLVRMLSKEEFQRQKKSIETISRGGMKDSISASSLALDSIYSVGIELDKALANPKSEFDLVLKPHDRIVIPEYDNTIKINGAVMYPNTVLYKKGEKLSYYVDRAGGFNDAAEKKRAYVVYMNGTVKKAKGSNKDAVQPGCEIIIPIKEKKEKMSLAETISIGTSVTSMASVVALLINALSK